MYMYMPNGGGVVVSANAHDAGSREFNAWPPHTG